MNPASVKLLYYELYILLHLAKIKQIYSTSYAVDSES